MRHLQTDNYEPGAACVAFGHFDGMHKGHLEVVERLCQCAAETGRESVLVSFSADATAPFGTLLTTEEEKAHLLKDTGLDLLVSMPGQNGLATNGRAAEGGGTASHSMRLDMDEKALGRISQRARDALKIGKIEKVSEILGHNYVIMGEVVHGKHLGRTVGMPTANIAYNTRKALPPEGVYATRTIWRGKTLYGAASIGRRPTVDDDSYVTVENHLIDFDGDLYGARMAVELLLFLRGMLKFSTLAEVKAQVDKDIQMASARLAGMG